MPTAYVRRGGCDTAVAAFTFDHRHRHPRDKGVPYEFTSADQLLKDFFDEVDRILKQAGS